MRWINGLLAVLLGIFAAVQINDPDFALWMAVYGGGAIWCAVAAARPQWLQDSAARVLLTVCLIGAIAATIYYWPTEPDFWRQEVWWESETAREGMGMMIVTICLLFPILSSRPRVPVD